MPTINLPNGSRVEPFATSPARDFAKATPPFPRVALAAAHVVADPLAEQDPWLDVKIDWDRTIAFRKHLWSLGLGMAEAMDTAQRGIKLDWVGAQELIRRSLDAMNYAPPFTPGALRGGSHVHVFSPDGAWVSNTYEDDVPADQEHFKALNAELSKLWKPIIERKPAPRGLAVKQG